MAAWILFIFIFVCTKFANDKLNKANPERKGSLNGLFQKIWPLAAALYYIGYWGLIHSLKIGITLGLFIGNWAIFAVIGFMIAFIIKKINSSS